MNSLGSVLIKVVRTENHCILESIQPKKFLEMTTFVHSCCRKKMTGKKKRDEQIVLLLFCFFEILPRHAPTTPNILYNSSRRKNSSSCE